MSLKRGGIAISTAAPPRLNNTVSVEIDDQQVKANNAGNMKEGMSRQAALLFFALG